MVRVIRPSKLTVLLIALALWQATAGSGWARNPWEIYQGSGPAPTGPVMPGGGSGSLSNIGLVPKVGPNFWTQQQQNQVPYGVLLHTVLQEDITTKTAKPGDQFHLLVQDGYFKNGMPLIPPGSVIVGSVMTAMSALMLQNGNPGRMDISIKAVTLPDGRTVPIAGAIDHNPAQDPQDPKKANQVHYAGTGFSSYGSMTNSLLRSFTRGIGSVNRMQNLGKDFALKKGTVVAVRITRSVDIPPPGSPVYGQTAQNGAPTVPGLAGPDPDAPVRLPAMAPVPQTAPVGLKASPGLLTLPQGPDPNGVFQQPMHPNSLSDIPDPF